MMMMTCFFFFFQGASSFTHSWYDIITSIRSRRRVTSLLYKEILFLPFCWREYKIFRLVFRICAKRRRKMNYHANRQLREHRKVLSPFLDICYSCARIRREHMVLLSPWAKMWNKTFGKRGWLFVFTVNLISFAVWNAHSATRLHTIYLSSCI